MITALVGMSITTITSYDLIDAQPNSEPPSIRDTSSIRSLDNQNILQTKIIMPSSTRNIAVNPETNMVYVDLGSSVSVINGATNGVEENITLIDSVRDIAVNPKTNTVYVAVADFFTSTVHVVDGTTNKIVRSIPIGFTVADMAVNPNTNMLYLTDARGTGMYIINGHTNKVDDNVIIHNSPAYLAVNPETNRVYVATTANHAEIIVIDGSNNRAVKNITLADMNPLADISDIDVNSQTNRVYATNHVGNRIFVIDGATNQELTTIIGNFIDEGNNARLSVDSGTNLIYVISSNIVSVLDGTTNNLAHYFMLESRGAEEVAINPKTHTIYASSMSNMISVINGRQEIIMSINEDISSSQQDSTPGIGVERNPIDIAVNPETNMIYVICESSNKVTVIDGYTNTIMDTITVSTPPYDIDVNPLTNMIYVTNPDVDSVIAIDGATNEVARNITISNTPWDIAIDPEGNTIYTFNERNDVIPSEQNDSISAIDGYRNIEIANIKIGDDLSDWTLDTNLDVIYALLFRNITMIRLSQDFINSSGYYFDSSSLMSEADMSSEIAVNPVTNLLYVGSFLDAKSVYEIDPLTRAVLRKFTTTADIRNIAVNPMTNTAYLTHLYSNIVSVIDLKSNVVENVAVGVDPRDIAINPESNMIYVTNYGSSTVSVIDGHTNKVIAGVTFNVNPSNAGFIRCNDQIISGNYSTVYGYGTELVCEAVPNSGFLFTSWSGDLTPSNSNDNARTRFTVSKYGALSANFINPVQINIPWEFLAGLILGPIAGWSIPGIINLAKSRRDVGKLNYYHKQIASLYGDGKLDENDIEPLDRLRSAVLDAYSEGKINEKHYESLKNEISGLYEEIFRKRVDSLTNNNSAIKKPSQDQLAQIRNEVEYAYSKEKINDKHYDLLNKAISKLDRKEN